jgi:hypothetical protein
VSGITSVARPADNVLIGSPDRWPRGNCSTAAVRLTLPDNAISDKSVIAKNVQSVESARPSGCTVRVLVPHRNDCLARQSAGALTTPVRVPPPGERKCLRDFDVKLSAIDEFSQFGQLASVGGHEKEGGGDSVLVSFARRRRTGDGDQSPAAAQHRERPLESVAADGVYHHVVDGIAAFEAFGTDIDDSFRAKPAKQLTCVAAHCRGDVRPDHRGELQCKDPYRTGTSMHQNRLTRLHGGVVH